ncbi:MAG: AMP-binding protein, partial [Actinomycetota bacterium]
MLSEHGLPHIEVLLEERRVIEAPEGFRQRALASDEAIYAEADADFEGFWASQADRLSWFRRWDRVLEWNPPWVQWFVGGKLNVSANCLDRHLQTHPDRVAYFWEGEPGDQRRLTYRELYEEVCRLANALRRLGVRKGDRVAIYLGMIPELPVAMLACARIGAAHSVVFGG